MLLTYSRGWNPTLAADQRKEGAIAVAAVYQNSNDCVFFLFSIVNCIYSYCMLCVQFILINDTEDAAQTGSRNVYLNEK